MNDKKELITTIFGGLFGVHKFLDEDYVMGFIYLGTLGLFTIGWIFDIYAAIYYKSEAFLSIKDSIEDHTNKCNELNDHIEELKSAYIEIKKTDYGSAKYIDNSRWNYKRPNLKFLKDQKNVYNCSITVCNNSRKQPFKYICKYFNIKESEENLIKFEKVLNDFSAAEQGKVLLKKEENEIITSISDNIPFLIKSINRKNLTKKLGFKTIDFSQLYFPKFTFRYVSSGGNSSMVSEFVFNINNLDRFVTYLSELVKFKKSVAGQRALMTSSLRERIKERDNYTCQNCGISTNDETNLLLEIDHIIPLSKNGLTTEENLQTLCWKCNRAKGSRIEEF